MSKGAVYITYKFQHEVTSKHKAGINKIISQNGYLYTACRDGNVRRIKLDGKNNHEVLAYSQILNLTTTSESYD